MAKQELNWTNFKASELDGELKALHDAMLASRKAFEAAFPCREGYTLRFAYQGADWDRMGVAEVEKPKDKAAVAGRLSDWIASQRAANRPH